jgi:hypothetical protein
MAEAYSLSSCSSSLAHESLSFRAVLKSSTVWFPNSAIMVAKTIALAGLKTWSVHPEKTWRNLKSV